MKYHQYKYKFYLNASHSIYIQNILGNKHPHTWEITIDTIKIIEGFIQFKDVEKTIEQLLSRYQDRYINQVEPFDTMNPTLENICQYFKEEIKNSLFEKGWLLLSIEISETPARSYIIDLVDEGDEEIQSIQKRYSQEENEIPQELIQHDYDALSNDVLDEILNVDK